MRILDRERPTRRRFLNSASLASVGVAARGLFPFKLRAAETGGQRGGLSNDRAVILVWLPGGPPHMETYDLKPNAPLEYRGEFHPIATSVPGLDVSEYLPLHAAVADRFSLIRSIAHHRSDHGGGLKYVLTGRDPRSPSELVSEFPMVGSIVAKVRESHSAGLPNYITSVDGAPRGGEPFDPFEVGSSYLGHVAKPFQVAGDPALPSFRVENLLLEPRQAQSFPLRRDLLQSLGKPRAGIDHHPATEAIGVFQRHAFDLLTSEVAGRAFDLKQESEAVRMRYGQHTWGQRALLSRRLVEAGTSFVTVMMQNPIMDRKSLPPGTTVNWDSHAVNCNIFTDSKWRLPYYDQAVTALIEDLYARGLDRRVLLVVTGEFGRTPRISYADGNPGRDHWPQAMSVLVSGGGLRMGQVIGATDAKGEHPVGRRLTPNDLWATMFRQLGIDFQHTAFPDHSGRPMPILADGEPIAGLL